jgi:uncharacterized membrane protein
MKTTSIELIIYSYELTELLFQANTTFSKVKCAQLNLVNQFFHFNENDKLKDFDTVRYLIHKCYKVNALVKKSLKLKLKQSLEEALQLTYIADLNNTRDD